MARSWNDLPKEIRIKILESTHLVRHWDWTWCWAGSDGANVLDGRLQFPEEHDNDCTHTPAAGHGHCPCTVGYWIPFPAALFRVSRQMRDEAREVFYSRNRFVFKGSLVESAHFLDNLPATARALIRKVDLGLSFEQLWDMGDPDSQAFQEWKLLIRIIQARLPLHNLWLSVDAGSLAQELIELNNDGDQDYAWLRTAYYHIFGPLRRLKGLKKFHVFLSWSLAYEAVAEKEIMGSNYESKAEGKIPYEVRDLDCPHRAPLEEHGSRNMRRWVNLWTLPMMDSLSDRDT